MNSRARRLITLAVLGVLVAAVIVGALVDRAGAAPPAAGDRAQRALVDKYAPYVVVRDQVERCGSGEPYRPVAVDSVLGDPQVVLRGPDGEVVTREPQAQDLASLGDGYYLDLPGNPLDPGCAYEEWFRGKQESPTTVYGRVTADPAHPGMLALQYWFWWVYNDWNDKHEGDWEMIQLLFPATDAAAALARQPTQVAFAQHEGSEVASWEDPKLLRDGDHVAVYPGEGSHAAYFTQARWFGKSAAAGFGCDDTGLADGSTATILRPRVELLRGDEPWLSFTGRWGEKAPSFNNGPTGPNTKDQWAAPVDWQVEKGRPTAVALPVELSVAQESFCGLTAAGSQLFIDLLANPGAVLFGLAVVIVLLTLLVRATRWRGSPAAVVSERTAGQILVTPAGLLRRRPLPYLGIAAGLAAVLLASYAIAAFLRRPEPTADLARVGAPATEWWDILGLLLTGTVAALVWCAAIGSVVAVTADRPVRTGAVRGGARTLVSAVVIAVCTVTVLLLPVAVYLLGRWAVATPAAVVEDTGVGAAGRRSSRLIRGRWARSFTVMIAILVITAVPGALVGALLLLVTSLPFSIVNLVVVLVTAAAVTYAAVAATLLFFDLRERESADRPVPEVAA